MPGTDQDGHVNLISGMTSAADDDAILGDGTNISNFLAVLACPFGDCSFDVSGSVGNGDIVFNEDNDRGGQSISGIDSNLTVENVDNAFTCLGLIDENDPASLYGEYDLDTAPGQINLKP